MIKYLKHCMPILFISSVVFSQVTEGLVEFKFGEHNALQMNLVDVNKNLVEDEWKNFTKPLGKTEKKKGEFITKEVNLEGLSNPVDLFMKLENNKKDVLLQLCVISNEEFLSSVNQSSNYQIMVGFLEKFAYEVEKAKVNEEFEDEKKELEKLQKKLKKLNKDYDNNLKSVKDHTKKIEKAEKDNKSNLKKQSEIKEEITTQGLIVDNLFNSQGEESEEYNDEHDKLLKMQKKLEKLVGDYEKNLKTMNKSSEKIEDAKKDNKSLKKDVEKLKDKISKQGKQVESVRKKLEAMN